MSEVHTLVFRLVGGGGDFEVIHPRGDTLHPQSTPPCQISLHRSRGGVRSQNWKFTQTFLNINASQDPCVIFTNFHRFWRISWSVDYQNLRRFAEGVLDWVKVLLPIWHKIGHFWRRWGISELWGFKIRLRFLLILQHPQRSSPKTFWRYKNGTVLFYHHAKFGRAQTFHATGRGSEKVFVFCIFLFVMLLNDLSFWTPWRRWSIDLTFLALLAGKVHICAPVFDFVYTAPGHHTMIT